MHRALAGCLRHQHAAARARPSSSPGRYSSAWRPLPNRHLRESFPTSNPSLPNPCYTNSGASQRTHCTRRTSANPTAAPFPVPALASARQGGVPAPTASTASSQPHLARCNRMATAAAAVAAGAGGGGGGEEGPTHVLVVCGTPEDSQRIAAAVKEVRGAAPCSGPPGLLRPSIQLQTHAHTRALLMGIFAQPAGAPNPP